jgi:DNA-binding MarR family transcriptional regulator
MKNIKQLCLAFSSWRIQLHSSPKVRESVRFFRRSRNHTIIWNYVMQGYFGDNPRTIGECEKVTAWSQPTTYKLLREADRAGFLEIRQDPDDQRKKLVLPTSQTIKEYESMVKGYTKLFETLNRR